MNLGREARKHVFEDIVLLAQVSVKQMWEQMFEAVTAATNLPFQSSKTNRSGS